MLKRWILSGLLVWGMVQGAVGAPANSGAPKINKQTMETYLRYAEGFTPEVQFLIDDPTASPFPGLYRLVVHLSAGTQKLDRLYYLTADGQRVIEGSVWDLSKNPFEDALEHLPKDGPSFGPANAKVTIVVFSDFECPYCRELAKTIRDNVPQKYPKDVRVVFENFPLEAVHQWARPAAEGAQCLERQKPGAFWAFHDYIFEHQQEADRNSIRNKVLDVAKQEGIDVLQVSSCMDSHATAGEIEKSLARARELKVSQTPTMFINGRMVPSALPWERLDAVVTTELNRPKGVAGSSGEKCCEVTLPTVGNH